MAGLHIQRIFGQNGKVGSSFLRIPDLPVTESISEQEKRAPVPYMYGKAPYMYMTTYVYGADPYMYATFSYMVTITCPKRQWSRHKYTKFMPQTQIWFHPKSPRSKFGYTQITQITKKFVVLYGEE